MKYSRSYLVSIQFFGFRFSGWQKQTNAKTLHDIVDKSLSFVLLDEPYKTIGVGRTDSKVSANAYFIQLFTNVSLQFSTFLDELNSNFPPDFRATSLKEVSIKFNLINAPKIKEYHYYFSFGAENHPFAAPFIVNEKQVLDIKRMQKGANLFQGEHYFHKYCTKPSANTVFKRVIDSCEIVENTILTANFFPDKSYVLKVKGKGFLRYQIRLMMATLFELGKGNLSLQYIEDSLKETNDRQFMRNIAPGSGLQLYAIELKN
jgi:tRNA pseudouridine38-40 synthase